MAEWLVLLLTFLLAPVALVTAAMAVVAAHLRRANRLLPGRRARNAPLRWLWSPSVPAMMHRRLRLACQLASASTPAGVQAPVASRSRRRRPAPADAITDLAREVIREAVAVDEQVFTASYMPRGLPKARALDELERQVRSIEDAARRVHQLAARRNNLVAGQGARDLSLEQRIRAMEEAFGELAPPPA